MLRFSGFLAQLHMAVGQAQVRKRLIRLT